MALRGTRSGTHEGELTGVAPTGRHFAVQNSHLIRVEGGKLAEHRTVMDDLGMLH